MKPKTFDFFYLNSVFGSIFRFMVTKKKITRFPFFTRNIVNCIKNMKNPRKSVNVI
jgi:hypothetical protein